MILKKKNKKLIYIFIKQKHERQLMNFFKEME